MKYFLIGIDGSDEELFSSFNMPFLKQYLADGEKIFLEEDLIGRGWTEVCTGKEARETNAYYERPTLEHAYDWTSSYSMVESLKDQKNIVPIWNLLNEAGHTVGIMNVPTAYPAPPVKGFFISGGGGGGLVGDEIPERHCYPHEVREVLEDEAYIFDERFSSLFLEKHLYDATDFFNRLKLMNERRVQSYLTLNHSYYVDFGFIVFRSVVVVENLFASERSRYLIGDKDVNLDLIFQMKSFYSHLDNCIKKLCNEINPCQIGFISDHSTVPRTQIVDINYFLRLFSYQFEEKNKKSLPALVRKYKHHIPYWARKFLKQRNLVPRGYADYTNFNKPNTIAFNVCMGTSGSGIYINDDLRFEGPVKHENIQAIANEIAADFNSFSGACDHRLFARVPTSSSSFEFSRYYPDILIDMPTGYQPKPHNIDSRDVFSFSEEVPKTGIDLRSIDNDLWTGTKGKNPMATFWSHEHLNIDDFSGRNLTCVYDIVRNEFGL
jgi:predicted AlkP superfamily phosphohydrolase/phosphomutase